MKKILSTLIAFVCVMACALSFTACDNGDNGNTHTTHNWSATYTQDGDRHYQTCDGCNEKNYASHTYVDGVCVCGKRQPQQGENPPNPDAELKSMSTYFSGAKVTENKSAITDGSGANKTFEEILDKQFDVLAQDILYRLYLVYGEKTYGEKSTFQDLDLNYTYNGNSAKVLKSKALTDLTEHPINHTLRHIDCIYCYQLFINGVSSRFNDISYIILSDAIFGEYHWYYGDISNLVKHNYLVDYDSDSDGEPDTQHNAYDPAPYKWQFNDYIKWNTEYRTAFKYELAKIVYGENTNLPYNELLAKINATGFAADTEQKIVDTIYKTVIGENLVAENLRIYNTFSESDKSNIKNWSEESETEKHYYKGYNIVVPAIVKQALNNTFENTTISLYPIVSRQSVTVNNSTDNNISVTDKTQSIVLMPKANTPVTTLAFEISGNAGQSVTFNFDIVSNGVKHTVTKTVTLTADTQTVEIDLTTAGVNTVNVYNGNTAAYTNPALFNNTDGADSNGENYIALNLENNNTAFTIKFTGMYDK